MTPKEIVIAYYENILKPDMIRPYLHPQMRVQWTGERGYLELSADELLAMIAQFSVRYASARFELTHIIEEENRVAVRYEHYVCTLEEPGKEILFSRAIGFWRTKEEKMYFGYVSSYRVQ
ncbi:nuclear transport factor 2 family protein [Flavobacterium sp. RHBU_24]|uniref:nuclear transport factor 2 family protein n=1 Tax=Flavobacterium sp. RHBU_24 TaxID=3391185 RepID=UPI0039849A71